MNIFDTSYDVAAGDVFDLWLFRIHLSDFGDPTIVEPIDDNIYIAKIGAFNIEKASGCCYFRTPNRVLEKSMSIEDCKEYFQFLPRPGELWNVWSTGNGTLHIQEHPLWLDGKVGNEYPVIEHKSELKWYDPKSD